MKNGVLMGYMILYDGDSMGFNGGLLEFPKWLVYFIEIPIKMGTS